MPALDATRSLRPSTGDQPARSAAASLQAVASLGAVSLSLALVHGLTGWGIPCPFNYLTGWLCPLCGATRAGFALLNWRWDLAWRLNPAVLVAAGLLALRTIGWLIEWWPRRRLRPAPAGRRLLPGWVSRHWLVLAGSAAVIYTLWRNLV